MIDITREHSAYVASKAMWQKYRDLYVGGEQLKANAALYLARRQKEGLDVYQERLDSVFYENYVGSIIDWYASTLLRREPVVIYENGDESSRRFFNDFAENCDLKDSSLSDFFRRRFVEALIYGTSYTLVDFPRAAQPAASRAEESARGSDRAYLVEYSPEQVINWSCDEQGTFEWVVIRTEGGGRRQFGSNEQARQTVWTYYDKETFQRYRRMSTGTGEAGIELVESGRHALAGQRRVPLFELRPAEGLWLMNKAALLQLEHFNKSNALSWALKMGLFAMPVIYTDRQFEQVVGESYYIQLAPGDRFGWTEPEGKVYQIAADNLNRLKDEVYRVCYLMSQAGGSLSGSQQSGLSKQRDFAITQEVLRAYGDGMKDVMKRALRAIAASRADDISIDISGLDEFDIGDFSGELADAERLLALGMGSPTLKKQVFKKLAFKYLCDVRQEVKDRIAGEIDEAVG